MQQTVCYTKGSYGRSKSWELCISLTSSSSLCFLLAGLQTLSYCVYVCGWHTVKKISAFMMSMYDCLCACVLVSVLERVCVCVSQPASLQALTTWEHSVSIRPVLILRCILPRGLFLVDREQIWTLCLWFCDFWACSLSKHEWKKRMWGQTGCYTRACFSSRVYKKMTGFVIMTVHGEAPW